MTAFPDLQIQTAAPVQLKFARQGDETSIEGLAAIFDELDATGDRVQRGAFTKSIAELAGAQHRVPMLMAHDQAQVIGSWHELRETDHGLFVRGNINAAVSKGAEALALVKAGDLSGLSIGYIVPPGGREFKAGGNLLHQAKVMEISLVSVPAANRARVSLKSLGDLNEFADFLRAAGVSRREAEFVARKAWPAITGQPPEIDPAAIEGFAQRISAATLEIKSLKGKYHA